MSNRVRMRPGKWGTPRTVVALREAATATVERVDIRETTNSAIANAPTGRLIDVQIIEAGWNTSKSRFYPAAVLARDVPTAYPAGTHMMLNHATPTEDAERPEGDLHNLAAVFEAAPYTLDGGKTMRVKARVFSAYQQFLSEAWQNIGVSIRGYGEGEQGEAEGNTGTIVTALTEGQSVDFVTHPGAGGRILALLEASRPAALREATTNELRDALRDALDDAYGENCDSDCCSYVSVMDFDADKGLVWYCQWGSGENCNYEQSYTVAMAGEVPVVSLADTRLAVVPRTVYVAAPPEDMPVAEGAQVAPAAPLVEAGPRQFTAADLPMLRRAVKALSEAEPTEAPPPVAAEPPGGAPPAVPNPSEGEDPGMGTQTTGPAPGTAGTAEDSVALAEAQAARTKAETELREAREAGDKAVREAESARTELARLRAMEAARPVASKLLAESSLPAAAQNRVLAQVTGDVPLTEANVLDEAAFKGRVEAAVTAEAAYLAALREAAGEGRVTGLGAATTSTVDATEAAKNQTALAEAFKAIGLDERAASVAAVGRR